LNSNGSRFLASLFLALLPATAVWAQAPQSHLTGARHYASTAVEAEWRLAFELAFGDSSPYSSRFPSLYDRRVPYEARRAITKYVLDRVIQIALREAGARSVELAYRPGGYQDFPVAPSAQLIVRANGASVYRVLNIIGYLAQQTAVIGSRKTRAGARPALEIVETNGRRLAERDALEKFWRRLASLSPKLGPGFSAIERGGRPGLYIIDSDGDWKPEDSQAFGETVHTVSEEFGVETSTEHFAVEYLAVGNDWKRQADGASYLDRLDETGRKGLRRRLVRQYRRQVERFIVRAFEKYAPGILMEKRSGLKERRAGSMVFEVGGLIFSLNNVNSMSEKAKVLAP
jgi:hypothetical protein